MRQHTIQTPYKFGEVHFYSTEIKGELVLFDTGPPTQEAFAFLKGEVDLARLKYLFITHCHVDHFGLASAIAAESDAEILLPRKDVAKLKRREDSVARFEKLFSGYGFDGDFVHDFMAWFRKNVWHTVDAKRFRIVEESDVPERLGVTCLSLPGHSQSDMVYLYGNKAITGDILLRDIFQVPLLDVDVENFSERFTNYDAYCTSLLQLQRLRGYTILPGHSRHVPGLNETIILYIRKLLKRAGHVKRFVGVASVQDVMNFLFGEKPDDYVYIYSKISEIIFLRDFLAEPGKLRHSLEQIGLFATVSDLYAAAVAK